MSKPLITIGSRSITVKIGTQTEAQVRRIEQAPAADQRSGKRKKKKTGEHNQRNRKIRSTSFNLEDPLELQLKEHADQFSSFSTYVKRLIHQDLISGNTTATTTPPEAQCYDIMTSRVRSGLEAKV